MRIYSLSKIIAIPFGLVAMYLAYLIFFTYDQVELWHILTVVIPIVALIVFSGQIDHWYLERHPLQLDQSIIDWLSKYDLYYQALDDSTKQEVHKRTALYERGRSFEAVGQKDMNDVPFDVRCIIASQVVKMGLLHKDYLMGDMDRIYIYKHPFPSPKYQYLHTVETDLEDGVMIFALDHLMVGLQQPDKYYNICGHGIAEAFILVNTTLDWPDNEMLSWDQIEQISGFTKEQILGVLGHESIDLLPTYVMYFFTRPAALRMHAPLVYDHLKMIFD